MRCWAALIVSAAAGAQAPPAWAPTVSARVDRAQAHLGDPIGVVVTAIHPPSVRVRLGDALDLGALTLIDRSERRTDLGDGRVRSELVLRAAGFELGAVEIPPIEVVAVGPGGALHTALTPPLAVTIAGLIDEGGAAEPRPPAPPVPLRVLDRRVLAAAFATAALALVAIALVLLRRRRRRAAPAEPPLPPDETALRELARLARSDLLARGEPKPFHARLTEVLRAYLDARYGLGTIESTTAEILDRVARAPQRGLDAAALAEVLRLADFVKFARHRPDDGVSRAALAAAVKLVEGTRPPRGEDEVPGAR